MKAWANILGAVIADSFRAMFGIPFALGIVFSTNFVLGCLELLNLPLQEFRRLHILQETSYLEVRQCLRYLRPFFIFEPWVISPKRGVHKLRRDGVSRYQFGPV